ncbi:MAG TPA: AraC family transcriptional regulator [Chitinophagaceae bacterium]|nr:AraC family transcriptional regulator [Chitinophagaceae bacterium]
MQTAIIVFEAISCLLVFLATCILLLLNKDSTHSKKMLVFLLSIFFLLCLNGVLYQSRLYLEIPRLHKVFLPFSYLLMPVAYLYTRAVIREEFRFRKTDWLLTLPAILYAVNLMPYYFMPLEEKKTYLVQYYQSSALRTRDAEGFIPPYIFNMFRAAWSALFIFLNYKLIGDFRSNSSAKLKSENSTLINWLFILNSLLASLIVVAVFTSVIAPIRKTAYNLPDSSLGLVTVIICLILFFRPKILYGIYQPAYKTVIEKKSISIDQAVMPEMVEMEKISINDKDALRIRKAIDDIFRDKKVYLDQEYSLDKLVKDTHIPRYLLSTFINREYGIGFREYLNKCRVEHFLANLGKPEWKNYTLEAMAVECGFNGRSTFIKNFKLFTGKTPSEFIRQLNKP